MQSQAEKRDQKPGFQLIMNQATVFRIALAALLIASRNLVRKKHTTLVQAFNRCMELVSFKRSLQTNDVQPMLKAEDMRRHFDEFNQIFDTTGLPAV